MTGVPKLGRRLAASGAGALEIALGRPNFARLARWLWLRSRLDEPNDPALNGERLLQRAVCRQLVAHGERLAAFDVGANVGRWSVELVRSWFEAGGHPDMLDLWAFEPAPGARDELRAALRGLAGGRLHVVGMAAGAGDGVAQLTVSAPTAGTNTIRPMTEQAAGTVTVGVTTLDTYGRICGIEHLSFVKIDAEGFDFDVLEGSSRLLRDKAVRWVQFEYNHRWIAGRRYLRDVFDLVVPLGYRVGKITSRGIEEYPRWHPELESYRENNYLLWHDRLPAGLDLVAWWLPEDQR